MAYAPFVPLRVLSSYSMLEGAIDPKAIARLARERGYHLTHADCTIICEYPKIGPHAAAMMARMAEIMGLRADQISVKATTSERLGFTGREEGIAAMATVTLVKA